MSESDADFRYSVAWIDLLANGRHLGRGVLTNGEHASARRARCPSRPAPRSRTQAGSWSTCRRSCRRPGVINRLSVAAFNEMWFRKAPRVPGGRAADRSRPTSTRSISSATGTACTARRGFLQYQFVVPFGAETDAAHGDRADLGGRAADLPHRAQALRARATRVRSASRPAVGRWRSTCRLASAGLSTLLHGLDRLVLDAGGRHYLAKDFQTTPERRPTRLPPTRRVARRAPSASTPPACGRATSAAASACTPPGAVDDTCRTHSRNHRRSCCSAAPARSGGRSSTSCCPGHAHAGARLPASRRRRSPNASPDDGLTVDVVQFDAADTASHERFVRRPRRASRRPRCGDRGLRRARIAGASSTPTRRPRPRRCTSTTPVRVSSTLASGGADAPPGPRPHRRAVERGRRAWACHRTSCTARRRPASTPSPRASATRSPAPGVKVTVVRPGFVHSKMTRGLKSAPMAATPRQVAEIAVAGIAPASTRCGRPAALRYVLHAACATLPEARVFPQRSAAGLTGLRLPAGSG